MISQGFFPRTMYVQRAGLTKVRQHYLAQTRSFMCANSIKKSSFKMIQELQKKLGDTR